MYNDTIVAIATPAGEGGIGIVRISGPQARAIAERLCGKPLLDHQLSYARLHSEGAVLDEVMVALMLAPRSYTREDVVEISGHGGAANLARILGAVLAAGVRQAGPGEFTLRAFLNGRLDLAQAEAVLDIITAQTRPALDAAQAQLGGRLSDELAVARAALLTALAHIEASLDFPEDEVPTPDVRLELEQAAAALTRLLDTARAGILYRQGLRVAIVGKPNVGKSSLLNALLGVERAIVTPIAGTTRDTVEEGASMAGIPLLLIDTAGIRAEAGDAVEQIGIERSRQAIQRADFVILVLDGSAPLDEADRAVIAVVQEVGDRLLVALNKADLPPLLGTASLRTLLPNATLVPTSALQGQTAALEQAITQLALGGLQPQAGQPLVTSTRHQEAINRAAGHVQAARESDAPPDLLAVEIRAALAAIGEVTGETIGEDLLDQIFSRFCIGK